MALEIFWTRTADRKFDKIIEYLLKEWNLKVTESFVKKAYAFVFSTSKQNVAKKMHNFV